MKNRLGAAVLLIFAAGRPGAAFAGPAPVEPKVLPAVHRNQQIVLVALGEGIRLSAPGRALKDGQPGETIPVLNTATRMALKGVVRDGWIEIQSPGDPTP